MGLVDQQTIIDELLPFLYTNQRSWMTADISVIKLEWPKLQNMLLHTSLDGFKPPEVNEAYKVIRDVAQWRMQVPNILRMVEVFKLQPIGCVQCERAAR